MCNWPTIDNIWRTNNGEGVAAVKTALQMGPRHRVVTVLCDSGTRHLSKFWAEVGDIGGKTDMRIEDVIGPLESLTNPTVAK